MVRENKAAWKANYFVKVIVSIPSRSILLPHLLNDDFADMAERVSNALKLEIAEPINAGLPTVAACPPLLTLPP